MKKWTIIGLAVAVLLGALGFGGHVLFSSIAGTGPGDTRTAPVAEGRPVEVRHADIESRLVLDTTIVAEPGVAVESRTRGTVARVWLADGQWVEPGAPVVTVTVPGPGAEDSDGAGETTATRAVIRAPASGTLSGLDGLAVGDPVEPGEIARIAKNEFRAVATVAPEDIYRFYEDPEEILLRIDRGPAPQECGFLSLGAPASAAGGNGADGDTPGGLELACRVPPGLPVFPGVRGELSIVTGRATGALTVPLTAVRGTAEEGEVLLVLTDGTTEPRRVRLGVSDGENVEVVSGLRPGDRVMDPVPLAEEFDVPSEALESMDDGHGAQAGSLGEE